MKVKRELIGSLFFEAIEMIPTLPSLGSEGWITDPAIQLNRLFALMFLTDYSQSNIYRGNITSIQYLIANNGLSTPDLVSKIKSTVTGYLGRYFDSVTVSFTIGKTDEGENTFILGVEVYRDGLPYSLKETLTLDGSPGNYRFLTEAFESNFEYTDGYYNDR